MRKIIEKRAKKIGLDVILLVDDLPRKASAYELSRQIVRSSTSIGCNYRSAGRAKSTPDFINKLKIAEEEADETVYWLEILEESGMIIAEKIAPVKKEAEEVLAIIVASLKTARQNNT